MPKKKTQLDRFADLTWNDFEKWAGSKIVSRGKNYQRQGRVHDLSVTEDNGLIAWVDGTERYATKVVMDEDGLPDSTCTCPYELNCKHGVAVVIEYLNRIEEDQAIPKASRGDSRLKLVEDEDWDEEPIEEEMAVAEDVRKEISQFLKGKTKAQLIDLIGELAQQHPEMAQELMDRRQLTSGNTKALVIRLRREIQDIGDEPGFRRQTALKGCYDVPAHLVIEIETECSHRYQNHQQIGGKQLPADEHEGLTLAQRMAEFVQKAKPLLYASLTAGDGKSVSLEDFTYPGDTPEEAERCRREAQHILAMLQKKGAA